MHCEYLPPDVHYIPYLPLPYLTAGLPALLNEIQARLESSSVSFDSPSETSQAWLQLDAENTGALLSAVSTLIVKVFVAHVQEKHLLVSFEEIPQVSTDVLAQISHFVESHSILLQELTRTHTATPDQLQAFSWKLDVVSASRLDLNTIKPEYLLEFVTGESAQAAVSQLFACDIPTLAHLEQVLSDAVAACESSHARRATRYLK